MTIVVNDKVDEFDDGQAQENNVPETPSKYEGKSMEDIIQMYENVEKEKSRLGNEVGDLRRYTDTLLQAELSKPADVKQEEEADWDYDTKSAAESLVEQKVGSVNSRVDAFEEKLALNDFKRSYPDFEQVTKSNEFIDWVKGSKYRLNLYNKNLTSIDIDAATELLDGWADQSPKQDSKPDNIELKRKKDLKAATLENGASNSGSRKKTWSRTEIRTMRLNDPDKFEANRDEIMLAYSEGRVRK